MCYNDDINTNRRKLMLTVTSDKNYELNAVYRNLVDGEMHEAYSYNEDEINHIINTSFDYAETLLKRLGFEQNIQYMGIDKENVFFRADVEIVVNKSVIFKLIQDNIQDSFAPIAAPLKLKTKAEFEAYMETINYYA